MAIVAELIEDTREARLVLRYLQDGDELTRYEWTPGWVDMMALDGIVTTPLAELLVNVGELGRFASICMTSRGQAPGVAVGPYRSTIERKSNGQIDADVRFDGTKILDVTYDPGDHTATFRSRPAITLPWPFFAMWVHAIQRFTQEAAAGGHVS